MRPLAIPEEHLDRLRENPQRQPAVRHRAGRPVRANLAGMDIVIAGGGVAGLEALLGLRAMARDRVRLTLIAPDPDFSYRPLAVAEPFALGHAHRVPLTRFAQDAGAEIVHDAVVGVDDAAGRVRLRDGGSRPFDALIAAPGGRPVAGVEGATTWFPGGDSESYGGLLRDIDEGYAKRIAIVVPPGAVWPLPAYELALMTAGEAQEMGQTDVQVTVVTPEHAPLSLFGEPASRAVAEELRWAGVELVPGVVALGGRNGLRLEPGGATLDVQRVFAVPRILGPGLDGLAADEEGFILTGEDGRVNGAERTWAAGDGIASPVKFGGLATHQARIAAAAIARRAGADDVPDPGEPVLHGRLLIGHRGRRLRGRGDAEGAPLWWPHGKIAGEYMPRWLAEHGVAPPAAKPPPEGEGVTVERSMRALKGPEYQYLAELGRQYRSADPAIASLGRRMREMESR
jgi:sulfide:quinone oxidoreductase